jgi:bifunctional DNase/RNase
MNLTRMMFLVTCLATLASVGMADPAPAPLYQLHIKNIGMSPDGQTPVVVLADEDEREFLFVWVGLAEAQAIMMELRGIKPPRPMTHDLIATLISELGGKVERMTITEMRENTYIGSLALTVNGKPREIDCRPSDGIAIALHAKAPIMATPEVMKHAAAMPDDAPSDETKAREIPTLGITVQVVTKDLAVAFGIKDARGVLVSASTSKDLLAGDIIIGVGDKDVNTTTEFRLALDQATQGKPVQIRLLREGKPMAVSVSKTSPAP